MSTPENLEGVMRRIQKLLAIANDGRGDPNEAASAAAMAEKMMRKYQLDNADIVAAVLMHAASAMGANLEDISVLAGALAAHQAEARENTSADRWVLRREIRRRAYHQTPETQVMDRGKSCSRPASKKTFGC